MKIVIIGGGIAGLTLGALLNERNIDFVINERSTGNPSHGHAFLMHTDGLNILNELSCDYHTDLPGSMLDTISLNRPDGQEIRRVPLDSWKCIKRSDMIHFLISLLPDGCIKRGRQFSHFIYSDDGKAVAAAFFNGEIEYGDLFVGADGSNSKVRQLLFGKTQFTPTVVKEIVGIAPLTPAFQSDPSLFTKYQHPDKGLSFGVIPVSKEQLVWFMQYDATEKDIMQSFASEIAAFCREQLKDFPEPVTEIMEINDFSISYIWNTTDFDLLPAFHHQNIVLIGDAAHLAVPFTSSGTTNAIIDAKILLECLLYTPSYEEAFRKFYHLRADEVAKHTALGRELKELFLHPHSQIDTAKPLPLISRKREPRGSTTVNNPIQILYFTDPICSTCWIIQPLLRKLSMEYGAYIHIEYYMGGLLSCWEDGNTGSIKTPDDAARHWEEACQLYETPLDGDIWIEDPLHSSYPPSIAFKAAQMQDENKAIAFLRRIREMLFLEKKNIIKWHHIENAAFDADLDVVKLLADFKHQAPAAFKADLELAKQYGVTGFPTLFFSDTSGKQFMLRGNQPYEHFENIMSALLPNAEKITTRLSPQELFDSYGSLTEREFAVLGNFTKEDAAAALDLLSKTGYIDKQRSKNGVLWRRGLYKGKLSDAAINHHI